MPKNANTKRKTYQTPSQQRSCLPPGLTRSLRSASSWAGRGARLPEEYDAAQCPNVERDAGVGAGAEAEAEAGVGVGTDSVAVVTFARSHTQSRMMGRMMGVNLRWRAPARTFAWINEDITPFHLLGLGVGPVLEAATLLTLREAETRIAAGDAKKRVRLVHDDVVELEPGLTVKQAGLGGDVLVLLVLGVLGLVVVVEDGVEARSVAMARGRESHPTYYFIAGCYISFGKRDKAQELPDAVLDLLSRKKMGGNDLPTKCVHRVNPSIPSIFIPLLVFHFYSIDHLSRILAYVWTVEFYKETQKRHRSDPAQYVECISISPADELAMLPSPFLPAVDEKHVVTAEASVDLDALDERALRLLLLGIMHRTLRLYAPAHTLLEAACGTQGVHVRGDAADKGEAGARVEKEEGLDKKEWAHMLAEVGGTLGIAGTSNIDLSSRLDSRIALLWDEIATKRGMVGI
ncbi:hypothetical protein C8R44DRAFT_988694 [Mycena epipterygia]|nr:hypothetical protein C8R44DRAFT_988694 [Mycena epipterygia]